MNTDLKACLFDAYEGFADKRTKNLVKGDTFIIDDRDGSDFAAHRQLYPWFCMIFARVTGPDTLEVDLRGNVPMSAAVRDWISTDGSTYGNGHQAFLIVKFSLGEESRLEDLAIQIEAITGPGAPRYDVPSYKHVCPRTAESLRRIARVLRDFRAPKAGAAP